MRIARRIVPKNDRVDDDADDEDHDHRLVDADVVGVLGRVVQRLARCRCGRGMPSISSPAMQAAPGERPALLEAADERRQRGGDHDVAQRRPAARAEHAPGAQQHRRDVVDPVDDAVGDRRRRAEDHDEHDRALAELEQHDRERDPRDRRHRLQAGDHRADRGAQHRARVRPTSPTTRRSGSTTPNPMRGPAHRHVDRAARENRCRARNCGKNGERRRDDVLGLPVRPHDHLPGADEDRDREHLGPDAQARAWRRAGVERQLARSATASATSTAIGRPRRGVGR